MSTYYPAQKCTSVLRYRNGVLDPGNYPTGPGLEVLRYLCSRRSFQISNLYRV